ncbi:hypothetical protein HOLleu_01423 [Holothuria leucospilota]|uniref:Uncharacterized protein n=1 Tax=Holothuria leucospilota TaxID=206669 RepID=A0A9Q1HK91_HOLLE|nr:hypothetical protein HOLleu_01423 [Holothuria leucospilota]
MFVKNLKTENWTFDLNTKYEGHFPRAFECRRKESCINSKDDLDVSCSMGYRGWLCSKCDRNFYPVYNSCLPCPKTEWLYIEVALICCFCVIICAIVFRLYQKERNLTRPGRSLLDIIISRGKLVLGFYQVVGEFFESVHGVNWPTALKFIGKFVSLIELNIFRVVVRPKCFDERLKINPKIEFIIGIMFPCTLICLSFPLYWIMKTRYRYKTTLSRFTCTSESVYIYTKKLRSSLWTSVIILLFVTYPSICTTVFQLYPGACKTFCLDMNNTVCEKRLRSDYEIKCTDLEIYHIFACLSTAAYVVGFPVALFLLLKTKVKFTPLHGIPGPLYVINKETGGYVRNPVGDSSIERSYPIWMEFLCENYKPQFWYWEIVELTRKVTQTLLITWLGWDNAITVVLTIAISVVYLMLHARYRPMKSTSEQLLQVMFSLTAILANVFVAMLDIPDEYDDRMSVALIILNFLVIAIVAGELFVKLFIRLRRAGCHKIIVTVAMYCKNRVVNIVSTRSRGYDRMR